MHHRESGHIVIGHKQIAYSIRRSRRRRRSIGLLVGREGEIRILAPARAGLEAIERLLLRQSEWIRRRIDSAKRRRELYPELRTNPGELVPYRGENFVLRVTGDCDRPQGCVVEGDDLIVNLSDADLTGLDQSSDSSPRGENPTPDPALKGRGTLGEISGSIREEVRLEIMLWYKREARRVFSESVAQWAKTTGLRPRRVIVSNARRQWGSCSAANDVRLNWRLITAPPPLLDYVIMHELAHIAQKNHSRRFWALVERYIPDCKQRRRELRMLDPGFGVDSD